MVLYVNADRKPATRNDGRAAAANQLRGALIALDPKDEMGLQGLLTDVWRLPTETATASAFLGQPPQNPAEETPAAAIVPPPVSGDLISHMVSRFLSWRLPENFNPDGGIAFTPVINAGTPLAYDSEPTGTNLFSAFQAEAMVRHMLEGAPAERTPDVGELAAQATAAMLLVSDVRAALKPFEDFARVNRSAFDGGYFAIDKPDDVENYASISYRQFRALLRAAGLFTDEMRPSQPQAADASVKPAEGATSPPADAGHEMAVDTRSLEHGPAQPITHFEGRRIAEDPF